MTYIPRQPKTYGDTPRQNAERAPASPVFMKNVRYRFRVSENSNMFNRTLHSHPLPARVKCCERMHDTTRILFVNIFLCFFFSISACTIGCHWMCEGECVCVCVCALFCSNGPVTGKAFSIMVNPHPYFPLTFSLRKKNISEIFPRCQWKYFANSYEMEPVEVMWSTPGKN